MGGEFLTSQVMEHLENTGVEVIFALTKCAQCVYETNLNSHLIEKQLCFYMKLCLHIHG